LGFLDFLDFLCFLLFFLEPPFCCDFFCLPPFEPFELVVDCGVFDCVEFGDTGGVEVLDTGVCEDELENQFIGFENQFIGLYLVVLLLVLELILYNNAYIMFPINIYRTYFPARTKESTI